MRRNTNAPTDGNIPEHDKKYRERHKMEIAEYNRLHPELRVRLTLEEHALLRKLTNQSGVDTTDWIRGVIYRYAKALRSESVVS